MIVKNFLSYATASLKVKLKESLFSLFYILHSYFYCHVMISIVQTWKKQTPWTLGRSTLKMIFCQIGPFFAKFGSLNVQIRNNFKNIIFIAFKWCKIFNYYVNSIIISCSTCQMNIFGLNIWFTQSCVISILT